MTRTGSPLTLSTTALCVRGYTTPPTWYVSLNMHVRGLFANTSTWFANVLYVVFVMSSTSFAPLFTSQKGHPMPESNACQLVLKYLLMNKETFVKAFHNRVYAFSSGSKFGEISGELMDWMRTAQKVFDSFKTTNDGVITHTHTHTHSHTHSHTHIY